MARLWVLLALLGAASATSADEGRGGSPEVRAEALRRRAARSYDLQDYARALADLRKAYRLDPQPEFLYAIGQAERMSGDCPRAVRSYEAFLRTRPPEPDAARTRRHLAACQVAAPRAASLPAATEPTPPAGADTARPDLAPTPAPSPPPAADQAPPSPWPGRLLLGGGLAVAAAGAVAFAVGRARITRANEASDYRTFSERLDGGHGGETLQVAGVAGMAVGGALAGAGLAYSLWPASFHAVFHF